MSDRYSRAEKSEIIFKIVAPFAFFIIISYGVVNMTIENIDLAEAKEITKAKIIKKKESIKVGQIWIDCFLKNNSDPFDNKPCKEEKVLAVKDGYVLYQYGEYDSTNSSTLESFVRHSHLKTDDE